MYIKLLYEPRLKDPIAVVGLPGLGDVGKLAVNMLIKTENAKRFAELYSPHFPDFVVLEEGVCRLPRYEFWESSSSNPNIIALTGDFQPSLDDPVPHNIICDRVLSFFKERECKFLITLGGFRTSPFAPRSVRIAFTMKKLPDEVLREGADLYRGKIVGGTGLLLAMTRLHGLEGMCILAPTHGMFPDQSAASLSFDFLKRILKIYAG